MFVQPLLQGKNRNYYKLCVCVFVALGIKHAMLQSHIFICGLPALQYFPHIAHERHGFRRRRKKKVMGHKMCVLIFSTTLVKEILHYKKNWPRNDHNWISVFM
jgi:hypothetical protein